MMDRERAIERLKECAKNEDAWDAHSDADYILICLIKDLGYHDVAEAWYNVPKMVHISSQMDDDLEITD